VKVWLKQIDRHNWREAIELLVHPSQESFVASNMFSLAEAYARPEGREYRPLAIYHEGRMVGFAMHVWSPENEREHWVCRFMIGREFQGQGFGRAGMVELLELMKSREGCQAINLCVSPDNEAALNLYRSLGFSNTGRMLEDQCIYTLPVERD